MFKLIIISNSKDSLKLYVQFINLILKKVNINYSISGVFSKKKKLTILKSPHVYKKSKEQFEKQKFHLTLVLNKFNLNIFKYLLQNKPKFITLKIKKVER